MRREAGAVSGLRLHNPADAPEGVLGPDEDGNVKRFRTRQGRTSWGWSEAKVNSLACKGSGMGPPRAFAWETYAMTA